MTIPIGPQPSKWLEWTLRSLAAQQVETRPAVCSVNEVDALKERLGPYTDKIVYDRFGPDDGQSDAINEGWRAVEADIYGWLNDDDCLAPGALDKVEEIFLAHPEIDVVFGDTILVENDGFTRLHPGPRQINDEIYRDNLISQPSCFVRKSALFEVGLLEKDRHYTMDWDLWIRLYKAGKTFHYLPQTLSLVRHYADTKTASLNSQRLKEIFGLVKENAGLVKALHTGFNFSVFHLAEYGPFNHFFEIIKRRFCEPKYSSPDLIRNFELFHFQEHACTALIVRFEASIQCEIYINQELVFKGETARYEHEISLPPGETLNLRIGITATAEPIGQTIDLI